MTTAVKKPRFGPDTASPQHYQGKCAEGLVMNYLVKAGLNPQIAIDGFEDDKDFTGGDSGELKIEVKSQVPLMTRHALTFPISQMKKILAADLLYVVSLAVSETDHWTSGKILCLKPQEIPALEWKPFTTRDGKKKMAICVGPSEDQKSKWVEVVYNLTEKEAATLNSYSVSKWKSDKEFYGTDDKKHRIIPL